MWVTLQFTHSYLKPYILATPPIIPKLLKSQSHSSSLFNFCHSPSRSISPPSPFQSLLILLKSFHLLDLLPSFLPVEDLYEKDSGRPAVAIFNSGDKDRISFRNPRRATH